MSVKKVELLTVGWREWVDLPDLKLGSINAKIDTGARTSSLHAFDIEPFKRKGVEYLRFKVNPIQRNSKKTIEVVSKLFCYRHVRSSNGKVSKRPVIETSIKLFDKSWKIELTLANRDQMGFRMLLGREAIRRRLLVDSGKSYYNGKPGKQTKRKK